MSEPYPFGHVLGRWYYALLKELSHRRYQVHCISATTNKRWAELASEALEPLGVRLSLHPVSTEVNWLLRKWRTFRRPFSYSISSELSDAVLQEARLGYDILHLEQLWTGYLAEGRERTLVNVHHLGSLDLRGVRLAGNHRLQFERFLIRHSERRLLRRLPVVSTLSARLASAIQKINPKLRTFVVPLGLDVALYQFNQYDRTTSPVIGFLGNMSWMPGYLAARRLITSIFPLVRKVLPRTRLLIAGWEARQALAEFLNEPGVTITENVADAKSYFEQLQVLTYPVPQGSGIKVKVLEAMAWGIPVVTTSDGVEGIAAVDGTHCFVTNDDNAFAQRVVDCLQDAELRQLFRLRSRALVEEEHSPSPVIDRLELAYAAL